MSRKALCGAMANEHCALHRRSSCADRNSEAVAETEDSDGVVCGAMAAGHCYLPRCPGRSVKNSTMAQARSSVGWVATKLRNSLRGKPREKLTERSDTHQPTVTTRCVTKSALRQVARLSASCSLRALVDVATMGIATLHPSYPATMQALVVSTNLSECHPALTPNSRLRCGNRPDR